MIVECTKGGNSQVEVLVLETCTETEVNLWQTTAKNSLVITVDDTITIDILIEAVTYVSTLLNGMVVEICLSASNTFILPTVELTNFPPRSLSTS